MREVTIYAEILKTARWIAESDGLRGLTHGNIAKRCPIAGISAKDVQRYWPTKNDIVRTVIGGEPRVVEMRTR